MFKVPDGSRKTVQNSLGLRMYVPVSVLTAIFMDVVFCAVAVYNTVAVVMIVNIVFVHDITVFPEFSVDNKDSISAGFRQVQYINKYTVPLCLD